jgi:2-methylisocitrate lyase-like PEP mutase family enzyme
MIMTQSDTHAEAFFALHQKGNPLILYNIWDAGSARAVADAGAKAIATGSWSVAAAMGFDDGQQLPVLLAEQVAARIVSAVDLPVTVDFEGGYAMEAGEVGENAARIIATGCVGMNFEDQVVGSGRLYDRAEQDRRITAIRRAAETQRKAFFINARTDIFLQAPDKAAHADLLDSAIDRAKSYHDAGASGFFAPGLADEALIARLCAACPLPVNIMKGDDAPSNRRLADLGTARISYGPHPYIAMAAQLRGAAKLALGT